MQNSIRNFIFLGLIMACTPVIAVTTNPMLQGPVTKEQQELNNQLIKAIEAGKVNQVKQLLAKGADANAVNQKGILALTVAIYYFYKHTVSRLREFEHSSLKKLQKIIAEAMINDRKIKSALDTSTQMCKLLIDAGADVNAESPNTSRTERLANTALLQTIRIVELCSWSNVEPIFKLLIDANVNVNAKDTRGFTPLIYAAQHTFDETACTLLIALGANVHAQDNDGHTALEYAALIGNLKACEALINAGATLDAKALENVLERVKQNKSAATQMLKVYSRYKKSNEYLIQKERIGSCEKLYAFLCSKFKNS